VYPEFGDRPLLAVQPATLRAWPRVYTHLLPSSADRTRRAIDRAFGYYSDAPDGLETA
jgi:hypothetical protein